MVSVYVFFSAFFKMIVLAVFFLNKGMNFLRTGLGRVVMSQMIFGLSKVLEVRMFSMSFCNVTNYSVCFVAEK